jgi:hypothetical protein
MSYPPGVTGARYQEGVYRYECPEHGPTYAHGYMELGGFFLDDDTVFLCDHAEDGDGDIEWLSVNAALCDKHGEWTEWQRAIDVREFGQEIVWECPQHHFFITEEY